jgi:hypothetical protein
MLGDRRIKKGLLLLLGLAGALVISSIVQNCYLHHQPLGDRQLLLSPPGGIRVAEAFGGCGSLVR